MKLWRQLSREGRAGVIFAVIGIVLLGGPSFAALVVKRSYIEPVIMTIHDFTRMFARRRTDAYNPSDYWVDVSVYGLMSAMCAASIAWLVATRSRDDV